MGDGVLVEFASAVNAVACAVELQKKMAAANDGFAEDRRIVLRIGINLGDVVVEGSDLYGDGVNIAARLEAMAEPGGICVSGKRARAGREQVATRVRRSRSLRGQEHLQAGSGCIACTMDRHEFERPAALQRAQRQALHRRAALRQHERRSRTGVSSSTA